MPQTKKAELAIPSSNREKKELLIQIEKDETFTQLYQVMLNMAKLDYVNNQALAIENIKALREIISILDSKYERSELLTALETLRVASNSPKGCSRNANGTTNWDDCNWWETLVVGLMTIGCNQPDVIGGDYAIEEYYNCVQSIICRKC